MGLLINTVFLVTNSCLCFHFLMRGEGAFAGIAAVGIISSGFSVWYNLRR
jgi:hypothetical protein